MVLGSVKSIQGKREYMEDRYAYIEHGGITIAMVCDGHGGQRVSSKAAYELPQQILFALTKVNGNNIKHAEAIRKVIVDWNNNTTRERSGSTLTGIAVKNGTVFVYNVGDSRTCAKLQPREFIYTLRPIFGVDGAHTGRVRVDVGHPDNGLFLTKDHDAEAPEEVARVENAGGIIRGDRLNGILSVTRALGDTDIGPGICAVPDVQWFKASALDGPILMYSDGVYEMQRYSNEHNVNFDDRYLYKVASVYGTEYLVNYAYDNGSDDNLTAMLVQV
jgi:serine/threonine protein phosphatase PrpC